MKEFGSIERKRGSDRAGWGTMRRIAPPMVCGLLALFLAGCETRSSSSGDGLVGSLFGSNDEANQPGPGQGQTAQAAAEVKPLTFAPVIGAPAAISSQMSEKLVAAANAKNLKVESSNSSGYTVRGYLVAASAPSGTKLSYIWDIRDQSGKRAQRFQGDEIIEGKKGGDPWALVDDAAIERIASSTADKISTWMYGAANTSASADAPAVQSSQSSASASAPEPREQRVAQRQPAQQQQPRQVAQRETSPPPSAQVSTPAAVQQSSGEIVAVVPPVTGAPGDGQQSLTAAMRRHLQSAGVKLIEGQSQNAYTVRGTVQLGSADGGQQPITIRWLVVDPNGNQIEKAVVQRNKIPAGSLDGPWGRVADLAASEAAKSVAKLIVPTG